MNAYRQIDQLVDAGAVLQASKARRNRIWLVTDVVSSVEAFMERTKRHRSH